MGVLFLAASFFLPSDARATSCQGPNNEPGTCMDWTGCSSPNLSFNSNQCNFDLNETCCYQPAGSGSSGSGASGSGANGSTVGGGCTGTTSTETFSGTCQTFAACSGTSAISNDCTGGMYCCQAGSAASGNGTAGSGTAGGGCTLTTGEAGTCTASTSCTTGWSSVTACTGGTVCCRTVSQQNGSVAGTGGNNSAGTAYTYGTPAGSGTYATVPCPNGVIRSGVCFPLTGLSDASLFFIIRNLMNWLLAIFGMLAIIAFVISGIQYLLAAGDESMAETAKNNMKFAIIGVVVALAGWVIIMAISDLLSGSLFGGFFSLFH